MRRYHPVRLAELLGGPPRADWSARLPALDTAVPNRPLHVGAAALAMLGILDDFPQGPLLPPYGCHVHTVHEAAVQSSAGILGLRSSEVVADTLDHTTPASDGYATDRTDILLPTARTTLPGRWLSLLLGNQHNHYHWLAMNFARLALLEQPDLRGLAGVLVPDRLAPAQHEALTLARLPAPLRPVRAGEALQVETLVLPWNVASESGANPAIGPFLRGLLPDLPAGHRRIYIDRRAAPSRQLLNEGEVASTLARAGVTPVRLEALGFATQARLMAEASLVVGAHGAGLANIAFCRPGTRVVELLPSSGVNWCYRHLAAACRLDYDCVPGRNLPADSWVISPTHVLSALNPA